MKLANDTHYHSLIANINVIMMTIIKTKIKKLYSTNLKLIWIYDILKVLNIFHFHPFYHDFDDFERIDSDGWLKNLKNSIETNFIDNINENHSNHGNNRIGEFIHCFYSNYSILTFLKNEKPIIILFAIHICIIINI